MNFKKLLLVLFLVAIIGIVVAISVKSGKDNKKDNGKLNVIVTNFIGYDFVRQVAGDNVNLSYLLKPGVEMHSYEPSSTDLADIQNADLFIYVGGEMEKWTDRVLETLDTSNTKVLRLMDTVTLIEEQEVDGAEVEDDDDHDHDEEEIEYDEHIWASPANAMQIVEAISEELILLNNENKEIYTANADKYMKEIKEVQAEIRKIVDRKVRNRVVFGDRMPMQYFINEFDLEVSAAFNGCSTETEPSSKTIAYLIDTIKKDEIPVVLYIELNSGKVANTIADETGATAMQIQSLHNISKEDFNHGETYVSLMARNLEVLKKALQ